MKKLFKILAVLVVLVVVVLVAAFFVVKSKFPPEKIQALVEEQASGILKREVKVGGAGFSFLPLGIQLKDLKIANNSGSGFSKEPFVDLPLALIKIDLAKLLIFHVAIDKISIENLTVLYEVMPDGRTSIDGLGGEPDTTAKKDTAKLDLSKIELPGSFALSSFQIKNAKVIFNDRAQKNKMVFGNINLKIALSLDKTLENVKTSTSLTLKEVSIEDPSLGIRKGGVTAFLNADINSNVRNQHLDIQKFSIGLQSIKISASGTIDRFMEDIKVVDLKVESNEVNLAEVMKDIPTGINPEIPKISASGTFVLSAAAKGAIVPNKSLPLSWNLAVNNVAINHSDLPAGISSWTGNIALTENTLNVKPFSFQLAGQPTSILLEASNLQSPQPSLDNLSLNAKLDLGVLFTLASKLVSIQDLSSLTGRLEANLGAKGILDPANPQKLSVNGNVNLQNIIAKTSAIPDVVSLNGAVKFSNTEISADPSVQIGKSDVKVKAVVTDYLAMVMPRLAAGKKMNINVNVSSSNLDLDRLLPPSDATQPPKQDEVPMEIYPELPDIAANININLANTVFRYFTLSDFNMGVNFANKKANIAAKGRLYTGGINTNIALDLSNRKSANVKFALNVDRVEANDFISNGRKNISGESEMAKQIRSLDNTVFGKFSMKMDVSTKGLPQNFVDNLSGPISAQIANGSLRGSKILGGIGEGLSKFEIAGKKVLNSPVNSKGDVNFDDLKADFEARDGQLLVKNFDINAKALGLLAFTGAVGFNGDLKLNLQNTLSSSVSSNLNNLTKSSPVSLYQKDSRGNAILYFNIGGTLSDPKVTLDASKNSNPVNELKDKATAKLNEAKDKATAKLNEEKAKLEAKKKEIEDKAKAEAEAKKKEATSKAKGAATDKAKGLLKGFKK
ncbi:MAG: hypothetical protein FWF63_07650 [Fibromonadales bacterium]|nr:hypothetical protein [Fibromonadales bacterium]